MHDTLLQRHLIDLFARHEIELDADEDGWLLTDDELPAIRATWHEGAGEAPGRLDVDVVFAEDRVIEESFAGIGQGKAGVRDALDRFERGALPVLLAACWYVTDERQLELMQWETGLHTWDVFAGSWMLRGANDDVIPVSSAAVIAEALQRETLTPALHALRLFHALPADGDARTEVLLDNAPWPAGTRALAECGWPTDAGAYSAHRVVVLDVRDY